MRDPVRITLRFTFRYRASGTGQTQFCTLPANKFIHLLSHRALPRLRSGDAIAGNPLTHRTRAASTPVDCLKVLAII